MKDAAAIAIIAIIFIFLAVVSKHEEKRCLKACTPYEAWSRLTPPDSTCYCRVGDHWELRILNGKRKR